MDVPVYLFTGFLESGKTSMIKETLLDPEFNDGSRTLILVCEQGEVEYDPEFLKQTNAVVEVLESRSQLSEARLEMLNQKIRPQQVFIEYNGMWNVSELLDLEFPTCWLLVQIISTVNGRHSCCMSITCAH